MTKLIILDRDGVINYDSRKYIRSPDEWIEIPGSIAAIAKLNQLGFTVAVATNQSGIARGYYSEETLKDIHQKMHQACAAENANIDHIVYCPHLPNTGCECRKPKPGLLHAIAKRYTISLDNVHMVGDRHTDVEAALAAGAKPVLIGEAEKHTHAPHFASLADFVATLG
jgi:D-glycero-D-manno-heptose 1,7-bisphosphate phosphatase